MIQITISDEDLENSYTITFDGNECEKFWINTQDGEGMMIDSHDLFKWIDKGYLEKF